MFYDELMKMCGTASNKAHKSFFPAEFLLKNLSKSLMPFQLDRANFGLIQLRIQGELVVDFKIKVVALP